ncbi:MAG: quinolinate synthase NadA, partial [Nitrospirota bacterium]|nr:quinolinate synthase NadA [Nitrospirota bacterium]
MSQLLNPTSLDSKEDGVNAPMGGELPIADYQDLPAEELFERIVEAKKSLGDQVLVLGHNYQRDEVIVHADLRGDSLLLSKLAAERSEFPHVVFCG